MSAKLIPFHNNIILKEIEPSAIVRGIFVPETHRMPINQGTVVDKGDLVSDKIKLGMIVFFPLHSESRMEWKGNKYIIVTEDQCLGAIDES